MPYLPRMAKRILVVDDEGIIDEMLQQRLHGAGFETAFFHDPEGALAFIENNPSSIDLAIIDHNMPEISGPKLASSLRSMMPELPIIIMVGLAEHAGFDFSDHRILNKFSAKQELLLAVEELLGRSPG